MAIFVHCLATLRLGQWKQLKIHGEALRFPELQVAVTVSITGMVQKMTVLSTEKGRGRYALMKFWICVYAAASRNYDVVDLC